MNDEQKRGASLALLGSMDAIALKRPSVTTPMIFSTTGPRCQGDLDL
jgi:hypothetical protein